MNKFHAVVIGAGSTGAAIAHDLTLRGIQATLIERFGPASGTTGHNQAQLHSGARYAVTDPTSARECIEENMILRKIMPNFFWELVHNAEYQRRKLHRLWHYKWNPASILAC
jgi:glycerol-3-phosphate dehydrogenase